MTREDREYFKDGVQTLCGTEVLFVRNIIKETQRVLIRGKSE